MLYIIGYNKKMKPLFNEDIILSNRHTLNNYRSIYNSLQIWFQGQRQTLMFSATFPDDIQCLASNYLHEYLFLAVGIVGGACSDVEQNFHLVPRFEKKDKLIEILTTTQGKIYFIFVVNY